MKFCEECGAQLLDDAIFCEECGASVGAVESVQPIVASSVQPSVPIKNKKKIPTKLIVISSAIVLALVIVVVGVIAIVGAVGRSKKTDEEMVVAETDTSENNIIDIDEAERVEETIIELEKEEKADEVINSDELVSVFNPDSSGRFNSWTYKGAFPNGVKLEIWDNPMATSASISNGIYYQSFSLDEEMVLEKEYTHYSTGNRGEYGFYDLELTMTAYKEGIDIKWIVYYEGEAKELCNGFYGLEYITSTSTAVKYDKSLEIPEKQAVFTSGSECFYKAIYNGELLNILYIGYYEWEQEDIIVNVEKDFQDNKLCIYLARDWYDSFPSYENVIFYADGDICYNKEAYFIVGPNANEEFEELKYSVDENGEKQYDMTGCNYYYEVRFVFSEENIDIYWSRHENGTETVLYDDYVDVMYVEKNITVKNY